MKKIDLHIHSNCSDGSDTVKDLAEKIESAGIDIFALTDHDTIDGCLEMVEYVNDGIRFIPSIELTSKVDDIKCHILGYNCDPKNEQLQKLIEKGKKLRREKLDTRIEYLAKTWGIVLTDDELNWLYSRKSVVKTHLANVIVNRGLAKNNIEAMEKFLDGCKTGNTRFTGEEAIFAIVASGGIPVWAHPLGGEGERHISEDEFLPKLEKMIKFGIRGLECYYSRYNFDEIDLLVKYAREKGLLITGGSDYHGTNKDIPLLRLNTDNKPIQPELLTLISSL